MTLEELLQYHVRGCYITTIDSNVVDGEIKSLTIKLHSGREIEIQCFGLHGMDAGMAILFEGEDILP